MQMFKRSCLGYEKKRNFCVCMSINCKIFISCDLFFLIIYKYQYIFSFSFRLRSIYLVLVVLVLDTVGVFGLFIGSSCIGGVGLIFIVICNNQIFLLLDGILNRINCISFFLNFLFYYCCLYLESCRRWDIYFVNLLQVIVSVKCMCMYCKFLNCVIY